MRCLINHFSILYYKIVWILLALSSITKRPARITYVYVSHTVSKLLNNTNHNQVYEFPDVLSNIYARTIMHLNRAIYYIYKAVLCCPAAYTKAHY